MREAALCAIVFLNECGNDKNSGHEMLTYLLTDFSMGCTESEGQSRPWRGLGKNFFSACFFPRIDITLFSGSFTTVWVLIFCVFPFLRRKVCRYIGGKKNLKKTTLTNRVDLPNLLYLLSTPFLESVDLFYGLGFSLH